MKKHLFDVYIEQNIIKKYLFKKTGLFQFTNFLERGISFKGNFFRTGGGQFGVPGDTFPP